MIQNLLDFVFGELSGSFPDDCQTEAEFTHPWQFVGGKTERNRIKKLTDFPTTTKESAAMSKDLQARGFKFVGSTICYAYMQAAGLVNDHTVDCFRFNSL